MVTISIILMTVIGAMFGAFMRDEYLRRRKRSLELESETPYDYALINARADNERYREEHRTIQATKRIEEDTERLRNEIDTMLSDDGEEATEGTYEHNIGMPIRDNGDGTFSPIFPQAGMAAEEAAWDAGAVARAYGTSVREDVVKDEQLSEDDVERSLTKAVRDSFENREIIRVTWRDSYGSLRFRCGRVDEIATGDGKVKEFGMRGLEIFAGDVLRIMKGDDIEGEALYRKGNTHIDEESEWDYM